MTSNGAQQQQHTEPREQLLRELRGGPEGVARWNARTLEERQAGGPFAGVDLAGAALAGSNLGSLDFHGARFDGANLASAWLLEIDLAQASLRKANLERAWCACACLRDADLQGASLLKANLRDCDCRNASFVGANLAGSNLDGANLCGTNLSSANLTGASVARARYDANTRFPPGFDPKQAMEWVGGGPPPVAFDIFVKKLRDDVDPKRLARALEMLKAERFQLYAQVEETELCGVVKSQTDEGLVYSCRLDADGHFGCCSQDLELCLGLRNALCKHILVLVVGLTRSKQIDPAMVGRWVKASRRHKAKVDQEAMSEVFLRYKSAEAGEIDWRPTETIPEDYYSL
jgi:hypothetical protein